MSQHSIHFVWLEGDSTDDTREVLHYYADIVNEQSQRIGITLRRFDHGGQYWPSIDHPIRWAQLASVWNENLKDQHPSQWAVVVESDLIWSPHNVTTLLRRVRQGHGDVLYAMLMYIGQQFYDTHATFRQGRRFMPYPPYVPYNTDWDGRHLVEVDTAGGLIATRGSTLQEAQWNPESCILEFPDRFRKVLDLDVKIRHPQQVI